MTGRMACAGPLFCDLTRLGCRYRLVVDWPNGAAMKNGLSGHVIGAYDAKTHFSELLERVEGGEEVTITRHGLPVAKMVPVQRAATREERQEAIRRWRQSSREIRLAGLRIRDLINEGRP